MKLKWSSHSRKRAAQGSVAALGAPLGWLLIEWLSGVDPLASLHAQPGLYAYMLFGTAAVLTTFGFYVGNFEASFHSLSVRDPLTNAFNRRHFDARLQEECARFARNPVPFALAGLDIDHFKKVNDTYGHAVGDEVLKHLVRVVSNGLRSLDVFARVGGEEFLILLPATGVVAAEQVIARLLKAVRESELKTERGLTLKITISIGLTGIRADDTPATLVRRADEAMYGAKQSGRDRLVISP